MAETRRDLFKASVVAALGITAVAGAVRAAPVSESFRALLVASYGGKAFDVLIVRSGINLTAYDVTPETGNPDKPTVKHGDDLSAIDLKHYSPLENNDYQVIYYASPAPMLKIRGGKGKVYNPSDVKGLSANAWCEVFGKKIDKSNR